MSKEEELKSKNWVRQFITDEPRLSEAVELYQEMGFEVRLEPFDPALCPDHECTACYENRPEDFKIIYTRKREDG